MKTTKLWYLLAALLAPLGLQAGVSVDANGWTVITPSADSRIVYVAANGNDANNGLSPSTPKLTISGASGGNSLIRDGFPDQLLLRRGDTFVTDSNTFYRWKNGRSATEPVVLSYYGSSGARPVLKIVDQLIDHNGQVRNHQAFVGLDIYKSNSDPASGDFTSSSSTAGLRFVGGGANILVEDCILRFCGVTVQTYTDSVPTALYSNFKLRRNIIVDTWIHNSATQEQVQCGIYLSGVSGYLLQENFFDHCGWSEHPSLPDARPNMFNHDAYIQYDNAEGGQMLGNIFARGAAHGLQARSGGVVAKNLFVLNAVSVNIGGKAAPTDPDVLSYPNAAVDNVVLNGRRMDLTPTDPDIVTDAVWAISAQDGFIPGVFVDNNVVANRLDNGSVAAFDGADTMSLGSNISYHWDPAFDTTNGSWPHPNDDLGDFNASIGGANSTTAYLQMLRTRAIHTFNWNQTAYSAINYIRAGFNLGPIAGYYTYPGATTPVATITASDATAAEPSNNGQFTVTLSPAPSSNVTVNLTRSGTATNGTDYTSIPLTVTVSTSGTATIPVTVINDSTAEATETVALSLATGTGYSVGTPNSATVNIADDDPAGGLPSPWAQQDIGAVAATGSGSASSGVFTINGSGADIWNLQDEFHYVYQPASGACEIIARVASIQNTASDAKAGVMIRESLTANSKHALMEITPSPAAEFIRRTGTSSSTYDGTTGAAPLWVRLVRTSGNVFTAYKSTTGAAGSWVQVGSPITISMGTNVYIGLAVCSGNDGVLCTAVFDNVTVTP